MPIPRRCRSPIAAKDAFHFVGLPEGHIPLAQAATYLASAPKSNASYKAMFAAAEDVQAHGALAVPLHFRNAPTPLMRSWVMARITSTPTITKSMLSTNNICPKNSVTERYYTPADSGYEKRSRNDSSAWRQRKIQNLTNKQCAQLSRIAMSDS